MMQSLLEDLLTGLGWTLLKVVSLGTYKRSGSDARLFEGVVGLGFVGGISWLVYRWTI